MSHRKFSAPRHGSLAYLPRKRSKRHRAKVKAFPADDPTKNCSLTAFIGYKAGMTHILRELEKPGSKAHKKEIVEAVTIIETPPMMGVGVVGYKKTLNGLQAIGTAWASNLSEECRRRFYKNWFRAKKDKKDKKAANGKAFTKYAKKFADKSDVVTLEKLKKNADVIRLIAHTQIHKLKKRQKKAHIMEIQVNGGDIPAKVDFCTNSFEKEISVDNVFAKDEMIDTIGVTKGRGTEGVITRWGITRLPRKTHRGLRKVACIGAWHPARVSYTVARVGQNGYHHRTETNKKVYQIGKLQQKDNGEIIDNTCKTNTDLTEKGITPMGGFVRYGPIRNDYMMIKGSCPGPVKRPITLRKSLHPPVNSDAAETVTLKFIDTSSKFGHGRFQTFKDKRNFMGKMKADKLREKKKSA